MRCAEKEGMGEMFSGQEGYEIKSEERIWGLGGYKIKVKGGEYRKVWMGINFPTLKIYINCFIPIKK